MRAQGKLHFGDQRNSWESDFFGREIRTLSSGEDGTARLVEDILNQPSIDLWECRTPISNVEVVEALLSAGFFVCDTACDFAFVVPGDLSKCTTQKRDDLQARLASADDIPTLRDLVRRVKFRTRFEREPFGSADAERFYGLWVENAVLGKFDDACAVLLRHGTPAGLVTMRSIAPTECRVGLICVAPEAAGSGIADELLSFAFQSALRNGKTLLRMSTQMTNRGAIAVSSRFGGRVNSTSIHLYMSRKKSL